MSPRRVPLCHHGAHLRARPVLPKAAAPAPLRIDMAAARAVDSIITTTTCQDVQVKRRRLGSSLHLAAVANPEAAQSPSSLPVPLTIHTMGQWTPKKCQGCGYIERNRNGGGVKPCRTCGRLWCSTCNSSSHTPPGWDRRAWRLVMRLSVNRGRCRGCVVLPNTHGPVLPAPPPQWPHGENRGGGTGPEGQ